MDLDPSQGTRETSQILVAGEPGVFSGGSPHILIGLPNVSRNNLEREVKVNHKQQTNKILPG